MIWFNCFGKPYWRDQSEPYIDPLHKFTIEDWEPSFTKEGEPKKQSDIERPVLHGIPVGGVKILPGQPINTSIFEEAIIIE